MALLFSSDQPLSIKDIQKVVARYHEELSLGSQGKEIDELDEASPISESVPSFLTASQIRDAFELIRQEQLNSHSPYRLQEGPQGYCLVIAPDYSEWVRLLRDEPRPLKLSAAALETLAIIAYRQPVTRAEMEKVRGVAVDSALNKLLDLGLTKVCGRAELPGRPTQYATTEKFLELAGLSSLELLPAVEGLKNKAIDEWLGRLVEVDNSPVGDEQMGFEDLLQDPHSSNSLQVQA